MRYIIPILILVITLTGCNDKRDKNKSHYDKIVKNKLAKPQSIWQDINLDIGIGLNDSIFVTCNSIKIKIKLTNAQDTTQRFLFDKPESLNPTQLEITDSNGISVIQNHWSDLSSKIWTEDELKEFYYELKPNHSINREFHLTRIAVIRNPGIEGGNNSILKDGAYNLRIRFGKNYSDIQKFVIKSKLE